VVVVYTPAHAFPPSRPSPARGEGEESLYKNLCPSTYGEAGARLAAGLAIGADIASAHLAMVGTIRLWTEVRVRVDNPSETWGEGNQGEASSAPWGVVGFLLTGLAERFVAEDGEGVGRYGAFAPALVGFERRLRRTEWFVGPRYG